MNAAGIHAAQCGRVQRESRCGAAASNCARYSAARIAPSVIARGDAQAAACSGIDPAVDLDRARDDIKNLLGAGVRAQTFQQHIAAVDVKPGETAIPSHIGRTGRERDAVGIDESATITRDAIRVGHNYVGLATEHFRETGEGAATGGHHFVQNNPGFLHQIQIGNHLPRQLGLPRNQRIVAVVQHQAIRFDVITGKAVVREAGRICRLNVHHRHAVG